MAVIYQWDVEELEEAPSQANGFDPDIRDHNFVDSFAEAKDMVAGQGPEDQAKVRIVLVRDVGNNLDGLTDRAWAYLDADGKLPATFSYGADEDSGILVPLRFRREAANVAG